MVINPSFQRLALLTGLDTAKAIARTKVMVFGVGGVGSWCAEALVRSGIGSVTIIDSDTVCVTNINRQVQATSSTVGQMKTEVLEKRLKEINPGCEIISIPKVFSRQDRSLEETAEAYGIGNADYIIDAIDSLTNKLDLIETTAVTGVKLFSSMGMAQKLDPTRLKTADVWETEGCPLARLVRQGLRKRGFEGHFITVFSAEQLPQKNEIPVVCGSGKCLCPERDRSDPNAPVEWCSSKKIINGSAVPVTASAGMILASLVIRDVYDRFANTETP
ncbi:tRNA threonylcarbamoyladenosine dehydratase [Leadbettera azotonutricia]|uniref:HesA/MoeB/ThiF family protein n=1 Tax=Leadbettera azotonutricia (strain ATCC BAA-888 / DSM 13862 / ZAS-9) TaxID=545695 RepID=F5YBS4_LEAAZ|nr:tRNA threonylcarbamoyladenosine dehydratase [Leadbettera azotonutricia]AEF81021.1 HesA/MoeB/ThiF family protein [Leadbettera azotonutricia ZAS-9]